MSRESYTPKDIRMLDILINAGYGWEKFASNVKEQGWISPKQRETLDKMLNRLIDQRFSKSKVYSPPAMNWAKVDSFDGYPDMGTRKEYYDEESSSWYGETYFQGNKIDTQWHDDGRTTYHWGGPCSPTTYDENGEEC